MHLHKYERIWLLVGGGSLVLFLTLIGISAFAMGHQPPSGLTVVDPEKVMETPPFDQPGLKKIGDNEYEAVLVAFSFGYQPNELVIPEGATVHFKVTSKDVVHGFAIPGTNVNMMVTPGHVNTLDYTFKKPGNYLVLCNEYCGIGHQMMSMKIEVTAQ